MCRQSGGAGQLGWEKTKSEMTKQVKRNRDSERPGRRSARQGLGRLIEQFLGGRRHSAEGPRRPALRPEDFRNQHY